MQLSGFSVPALTVRRATSTLQMADGETLVIGGLYSNTVSRQVNRIPLLSQIPVLGEFFKSTTTRKEESELLILIQPEIVTPGTAEVSRRRRAAWKTCRSSVPMSAVPTSTKIFPELQQGGGDKAKPGPPVSLPPIDRAKMTIRVLIAEHQFSAGNICALRWRRRRNGRIGLARDGAEALRLAHALCGPISFCVAADLPPRDGFAACGSPGGFGAAARNHTAL